ncbi:hypothetical protein Tco_0889237 [Tanacetum coccineum]
MSKPSIRKWTLWVCSLEALTRLNSSTWATKWFKRLVVYAKCNRDSYKTELGDKELARRGKLRFLPDFKFQSNAQGVSCLNSTLSLLFHFLNVQ